MAKTEFKAQEDQIFDRLVKLAEEHSPKVREKTLKKAYDFGRKAHDGQYRQSGAAYICHPLEAACILAKLGVDEETLVAAILHDVPEDTSYTVEDIENRFGKRVAAIVNALTKLSRVYYKHSMGERQIMSLRKMFLETAEDPRVVVVKLADRLHNMSTIHYLRPDKQQRIARETLEIYAPLANLYGIYELRRQLEDYCFKVLQPEEYRRIESFVQDTESKRTAYMESMKKSLEKRFKKEGLELEIAGRHKHFYSIYKKMVRDNKTLSDIYDYFAVRILTDNKDQCYCALGIVHEMFKPKPRRFKDYIAIPKTNGYQSLHTTVVGLKGQLTEVQIRTKEMHREAEFGAASHLSYKDGKLKELSDKIKRLQQYEQAEQFLQRLQEDVLQDRIYVFSPDGDVVTLPDGASCLDYIFAVNLEVENRNFRAIVNGKAYSLIGKLQDGDLIEIQFNGKDKKGLERWWLEHVVTNKAKETIRDYFKKKSKKEVLQIGAALLQKELDHEHKDMIAKLPSEPLRRATEFFQKKNFNAVLRSIGQGDLSANDVYKAMYPELEIGLWQWIKNSCLAFLKRHKLLNDFQGHYDIRVMYEGFDRPGLLKDALQPFYDLKIPLIRVESYGYNITRSQVQLSHDGLRFPMNPKCISRTYIDLQIQRHEELLGAFDRLEKIPGTIRVQRLFKGQQIKFYLVALFIALWFVAQPFVSFSFINSNWYKAFDGELIIKDLPLYIGYILTIALLLWLKKLTRKTFPHFGETRFFWPIIFGLTLMLAGAIIVQEMLFDLNIQFPILSGLTILLFVYLVWSYQRDLKQRNQHLNLLKEASR